MMAGIGSHIPPPLDPDSVFGPSSSVPAGPVEPSLVSGWPSSEDPTPEVGVGIDTPDEEDAGAPALASKAAFSAEHPAGMASAANNPSPPSFDRPDRLTF